MVTRHRLGSWYELGLECQDDYGLEDSAVEELVGVCLEMDGRTLSPPPGYNTPDTRSIAEAFLDARGHVSTDDDYVENVREAMLETYDLDRLVDEVDYDLEEAHQRFGERDRNIVECPVCSEEFARLGQHWAMSQSCERPEITDEQWDAVVGCMLGDGGRGLPNRGTSNNLVVTNTQRDFLEWLGEKLDWLTHVITQPESETAERRALANGSNPDDYSDIYLLETRALPVFDDLDQWYRGEYTGGRYKQFPNDVTINPLRAKIWYASDGTVRQDRRSAARITAKTHAHRGDFIASLFEESTCPAVPTMNSSGRIYFTVADTPDFLEWLGDPVPGYEYKWDL